MSTRSAEGWTPEIQGDGDRLVAVLFVINQLGPGGTERSLADLVTKLAAEGIAPSIVCLRPSREAFRPDAQVSCPVRILRTTGRLEQIRELRRILGQDRPDIVHAMLFEADLAGRLAAAGTRIPVLSSLVNTSYDPVRFRDPNVSQLRLRTVQFLDAVTGWFLTTHFHAVTAAVKVSAVRTLRLPPDRITVVPRGRSVDRLGSPSPDRRARARDAIGLAADDEVVVNVGRQDFQKGHGVLVEAAALLAPARPRLKVVIAGKEGSRTPALRALVDDRGLADTVRFLGNRSDVPEILAAGDVFAFPSLYEGIGGAVIEAMALGLPVVCSDLPTLREVVAADESALTVPSEDPDALAAALARLLEDPALAKALGARGREIFQGRFSLERSAAGMARLYRSVLEGGALRR